jgi:hypothetical protein
MYFFKATNIGFLANRKAINEKEKREKKGIQRDKRHDTKETGDMINR